MIIEKEVSRLDNENNLYIDLRPHGLDVFLKYLSWKDGLAVFRRDPDSTNWQPEEDDPDIPLIVDLEDEHDDLPVVEFIKDIPTGVINTASMFDYLQTTLLQWMARVPEAKDLLLDLSVMLWMIADADVSALIRSYEGSKLLGKKRIAILESLFKTEFSKADIKFIKKIQLFNGTQDGLSLIKRN